MNIGSRLKLVRERLGLSQTQLARLAGVSQPTISDLESGDQSETRKLAAIARALRVTPTWLATGTGPVTEEEAAKEAPPEHRYELIPRVRGTVSVSTETGVTWEHEEIDRAIGMPREWLKRKGLQAQDCRIVTMPDDAMGEKLAAGDVALIDLSDTKVASGKVYAIEAGGELRLRRLFRMVDGSLRIACDSPDKAKHPDEMVPADRIGLVRVLGRMRWHASDID